MNNKEVDQLKREYAISVLRELADRNCNLCTGKDVIQDINAKIRFLEQQIKQSDEGDI
jgi:hypothetical protein